MAAPAQVTWARTRGAQPDILDLGGTVKSFLSRRDWRLSSDDAIAMIEQDEWRFFVVVDGEKVWLKVEEARKGEKRLDLVGEADLGEVVSALPDSPKH